MKQLASYNTAPDWGQGGVWQSGTGLAADEDGYIYAVVGNGERPSTNAKKNPPILPPKNILKPVYGNSILKMELTQSGGKASLDVVDWFTASDTMNLNEFDNDFIGGPVLFDVPPVDGSSGHLIIGGGKDGKIYLGDRNFLGSWMPGVNRRILQAEKLCSFHIHGAPVVWENSKGEVGRFRMERERLPAGPAIQRQDVRRQTAIDERLRVPRGRAADAGRDPDTLRRRRPGRQCHRLGLAPDRR